MILYKDNQLLVLNKPPGLPSQPDKTGDTSLLDLATIYCKHPVFIVHRLDRTTSGIVVFAKKKTAATALSRQWSDGKVQKTYLAIVAQPPPQAEGELVHYLRKHGRTNTTAFSDTVMPGTQRAALHYRLRGSSDRYFLLEIALLTGRHHQIRAQLAAIGCPVKGDVKYGFRRGNSDRSIGLHAWKITFAHPVSGEVVALEAPLPEDALWHALAPIPD